MELIVPIFRILPALMNAKLCLWVLFTLCEAVFRVGALTDDIWRELCSAASKIEKSTFSVTNSVVKSSIEFSESTESDLTTPLIKANAIMMGIRYLMNFFTLIRGEFVYNFIKILPHNNFVCKYNAFLGIRRYIFLVFCNIKEIFFLYSLYTNMKDIRKITLSSNKVK